MITTGTTTSERPVEDGRGGGTGPSPTRGWIALAVLLGVYVIGALDRLDPTLLASLLSGGL
ncbi:hypothetical protein [Actinomycetospora atypica]|uniref:Uncharacterized protein n=1 Tax=Actinomycetospora atypica TaxID=1290095 RepID=A0ABV9YRS1_9PSEU